MDIEIIDGWRPSSFDISVSYVLSPWSYLFKNTENESATFNIYINYLIIKLFVYYVHHICFLYVLLLLYFKKMLPSDS